MKKTLLKSALMALAGVGLMVGSAMATPTLTLYDGTNTVTVNDDEANDSYAAPGIVTYIGSIGEWNLNVSTGINLGTPTEPRLDLNSVNTSTGDGSSLRLEFYDYGFDASAITGFWTGIGGTTEGTITGAVYYSLDNGTSWEEMTTFGPFVGSDASPSAFSGSSSIYTPFPAFADSVAFKLTATISHAAGDNVVTSFDEEIAPVPEPATMLLFGTGLAGLAGIARRRKK